MTGLPTLLLDIDELAVVLHSSRAAIYRRLQHGDLPIPLVYVGRKPLVRLVDVEAYLAQLALASAEDQAQLRPVEVRRSASRRKAS